MFFMSLMQASTWDVAMATSGKGPGQGEDRRAVVAKGSKKPVTAHWPEMGEPLVPIP